MKAPEDRFLEKVWVDTATQCWLWAAACNPKGYGNFSFGGGSRAVLAHRWAYERFKEPIPSGLQLDHLCRVRHCVNPHHLEPVTNKENAYRGDDHNVNKTHCSQGHEYTVENTYRRPNGKRYCRQCHRTERRIWREKKKAALTCQ